ncbi:hypothetical protein DSM104299_01298 [Baekduia alba]|uniref:hypothetical protein n=1 Tax=Baekduia alba TaxID=2997333 RepID=UPI00233FD65E|nr:hypothetical protein [Baekduia alba]WCB92601.1 hypothetical protein DSM104299_01298 [Baekduia alba]
MSFLIDPPWLYANGRALAKATPPPQRDKLAAATLGVFLVTSVSLYLDKGWTKPIWRLCRARSGRDWMLNSGVFRLDPDRASTSTHLVSGALFATYPLWLWLGLRHGRD